MDTTHAWRHGRFLRMAMHAATLCALVAGSAHAVPLDNLRDFPQLHGRYAPGGDCARTPRIVVDAAGFAFEGGAAVPKATAPEYAASWSGVRYEGEALAFLPFTGEPKPLLLVFNPGERMGQLTVEAFDRDNPGVPPLPARYRAYIEASPYAKCR